MNKVVQLLEPGPNDGKEIAIPRDAVQLEMTSKEGNSFFRVTYGDTGRRNELGFPLFSRIEKVPLEVA